MYLITKDYQRCIQTTELISITSNDASVRVLVEGSVEREIRSYLIQRYDLTTEFRSLDTFSMAISYKAGQRVYLDATAYSALATYALGALVLQAGNVYVCTTAIGVPEAFTIGNWGLLGAQYDLFYVTLPNAEFDHVKFYYKNDIVWWKDKNYTARRDSTRTSHESDLQSINVESITRGNVFPDDGNVSAALAMWGTGVAYSVAAGTLPTNTTYWTKGDNRNQFFVAMYLDMVVYELCKRIAPGNVPEARHNAWLSAVNNLKSFAKGNTTAELPMIQPKQGSPIRYGGKVRQETSW